MTTETPAPRAGAGVRIEGLGLASAGVTALGAVLAVAGLAVAGAPAALGAAAGALLVVSFFSFGAVSVNLVATVAPRASMLVALMTYTLQVLMLALVLVAVSRSGASPETLDVRWLAGAVIAGTLVWMGALLVGTARSVRAGEPTPAAGRAAGRTGGVTR